MPVTTISGHQVHVDPEGFLTEYAEWDDDLGRALDELEGIARAELRAACTMPAHDPSPH